MKEKTGIAAFSEAFRQGKNCGKAVSNPQPIMTQKERKFKKKRNFPSSRVISAGKMSKREEKRRMRVFPVRKKEGAGVFFMPSGHCASCIQEVIRSFRSPVFPSCGSF